MSKPPLISFVMITYKQEAFVREAVEAALAQDWPNLEIVISDDCTPDGTWDVIQKVVGAYTGPHRVITHRQAENVGPGPNVVGSGLLASGKFHVRADGDDISLPHRVRRVAETWHATGAWMIASNARHMSAKGEPGDELNPNGRGGMMSLEKLCGSGWTPEMLGATFSWDPRVFDVFGPFDRRVLPRGGDHLLPVRAAMMGGYCYIPEVLVHWRKHGGQETLRTADFGGSSASMAETMLAYDLTAQLARLRELRAFGKASPQDTRIGPATVQTASLMVQMGQQWASKRSLLEKAGPVLDWSPRRPRLGDV